MEKLFKNPVSGEEKTSKEWALILDYASSNSFINRYHACHKRGETYRAFLPAKERAKRGMQCKKPKLYTNNHSAKKESLSVKAWSKKLGINESTFRVRLHSYGVDDPRCFMPKMQRGAVPGRPNQFAKHADGDLGKLSNRDRRKILRQMPPIGIYEQDIPDRWAHIKGEP